jgi:hypothetical protein
MPNNVQSDNNGGYFTIIINIHTENESDNYHHCIQHAAAYPRNQTPWTRRDFFM